MSFTMQAPQNVETPHSDMVPLATSTGCKPDGQKFVPRRPAPTDNSTPTASRDMFTPQTSAASNASAPVGSTAQTTQLYPPQMGQGAMPAPPQYQWRPAAPARQGHIPTWHVTFTGEKDENFDSYLCQFEHYAYAYALTNADAAALLISSLRGGAANLIGHIMPGTPYADIVALLRNRFAPGSASAWLAGDFSKQMRQKDEPPRDYLDRLTTLAMRTFP